MEKLLTRHAQPVAQGLLAAFPGLIIEGARQVGKSTLAGQLAAERPARLTNLDHEATRAAAQVDPEAFVAQARDALLVIDEIQRLPALTLAVKAAIDADRRPGRFLMTGSASLLRVRGLADSLAGRVGRLNLYGLSAGERLGLVDDIAAQRFDQAAVTGFRSSISRSDLVTRIAAGGYPELVRLRADARRHWLSAYLTGLTRRDLPELRKSVSPARTMSVLGALAGNQGGELVRAKLAESTQVPASTISGYLDLLHDVGLVASLPPWTPNLAKREVGRRKGFILDSALAMQLARVTEEQLNTLEYGEALGKMLEGFVVAELMKQQTWTARPFELFHYRDRAGAEVDMILEFDDGSVVALEVKSSSSFSARQFHGLQQLKAGLGDRLVCGIVLNTGQTGFQYASKLFGLPVSALWEYHVA